METTILIIEANPDLRKLFGHLLRSDGYRVEACADWQAAQGVLTLRTPGLIIYDWDPRNSAGYLWAEALHSAPETARIPLLFVCEGPPRQVIEQLNDAGIAMIDKPFDIFEFRRRVDALIGTRERALGM